MRIYGKKWWRGLNASVNRLYADGTIKLWIFNLEQRAILDRIHEWKERQGEPQREGK